MTKEKDLITCSVEIVELLTCMSQEQENYTEQSPSFARRHISANGSVENEEQISERLSQKKPVVSILDREGK